MTTPATPLRSALAACSAGFAGVVVISFFLNLLLLVLPLYLLQVYSRVIPSRSEDTLIYLTGAALLAFLSLGLLYAIRARLLVRIGQKFDLLLGARMVSALLTHAVQPGADTNVQGLRDLETVRSFVGGNESVALLDAPWAPIFILAIYVLHPTLGMIALVGTVVLLAVGFVNEILTRRPLSSAAVQQLAVERDVDANLRNADVIDAMGMREHVVRRWLAGNARVLELQRRAGDRGATMAGVSRFVRYALQAAMLCGAAFLVVEQSLHAGVMFVAVLLMGRAVAPVEQAISTWKRLVATRGAYRRISQLLNAIPFRAAPMSLPPPVGVLKVEGLTFSFADTPRPLLINVSFSLQAGQSLGVIGPTAAGKSTLTKLLVGIWRPLSGHVRLDGVEVSAWNSDELGRYIGYLPQDVELFDGTIRENIARLADGEPDRVVTAASIAGVHELILRLPEGYETRIGRGGIALSGGQRQRIALARAFFGSPRLVVLDEPNANLDPDGELALREALRLAKAQGITVIVIAHRQMALAEVDKLLVLRAGRVEEFGSRDEVLAKIAPPVRQPRVVNLQRDAVRTVDPGLGA